MVAAELGFLPLEHIFEQRDGFVEPLHRPVACRQAGHALEGVGVAGAEFGLHQGQRLLEERQGLVQLPGGPVAPRQVVHAGEGVGVVGAELGLRRASVSSKSGRALSSFPASW